MIDLTQPEIQFATSVVRKACQMAQRVQTGMAVQGLTKSDFSPVTVADFAVQAVVGRALAEALPEAVLVGEESSKDLKTDEGQPVLEAVTTFVKLLADDATPDRVCDWIDHGLAEPGDRFWTLDPIDGTKGYLRGGQYAIALALIENGQVQLGVLGCPNLGDNCQPDMGIGALAVAKRGEGAWLNVLVDPEDQFTPLHASTCADPKQARIMRSVEAGHTNVGEIDHIAEKLAVEAEPVCMDSQAKYATLAAGGAEVLLRLLSPKKPDYKECIWDQAAGSMVLEEAGGKITDLKGNPLDFSQGRRLNNNTGVCATNGPLHGAVLDAIAAVCQLP